MKNTSYKVLTVDSLENIDLSQVLYTNQFEQGNKTYSTLILGGQSQIALQYFDLVDKYKLTESQIENNRLFSDYHQSTTFDLSELRSIPGIVEVDLNFYDTCDFMNNFNNCQIIQQVTYRTNDQPHKKYDSRYSRAYKEYLLEHSNNFRCKFFYIKKYEINELLDECQYRSIIDVLTDLIANHKSYKAKGIDLTAKDTDVVFNNQGVLCLNKEYKAIPCYNPIADNSKQFYFKNIDRVIKLYSMLSKQFEFITIRLESEKSLSLKLTCTHYPSNINYRFTFNINDQLKYELDQPGENLDRYKNIDYLSNELILTDDHIEKLNKDEIGLQIVKYIASANKTIKKKVFKKNAVVDFYLTPMGHYLEQKTKKDNNVYQLCPSPCSVKVYEGFQKILPCSIKLNVNQFYDVMTPYWLQNEQDGIEYLIVPTLSGSCYQLQAIRNKTEVLATVDITAYYGSYSDCIVTRWLSSQG